MRNQLGDDFMGSLSTASHGRPCIMWSDVPGLRELYPGVESLSNKCHYIQSLPQANIYKKPWCYVDQATTMSCDVPFCGMIYI